MGRRAALAMGAILLCLACNKSTGLDPERNPDTNDAPAVGAFMPPDTVLEALVGETVHFSIQATDADGDPLTFSFFLDDSLVSTAPEWHYNVDALGPCRVRAIVSDASHDVVVSWRVTRYATFGDAIELVSFQPGPHPSLSVVRWIAGSDSRGAPLSGYMVRTATAPITTEFDWSVARTHVPTPPPVAPGDTMTMVLHDLTPLTTQYVSVRGIDTRYQFTELGAALSLATVGMSLTGVVTALPAGVPAVGATVRLGLYSAVTGSDGVYTFENLPFTTSTLEVTDDDVAGEVGDYYDYGIPYATTWVDTVPLYLLADHPIEVTAEYSNFFLLYRHLTVVAGIPVPTQTRRWELPIPLYVPPFANGGLDYRAAVVEVAADINATTGLPIFSIVGTPPAVGVTVGYDPLAQADRYHYLEWSADWYPLRGEVAFRTVYQAGDALEFRRVVRHELGHALGLSHSYSSLHLMYPLFPTLDDFHPDEIAVIRTLYGVPRGLDVTRFRVE